MSDGDGPDWVPWDLLAEVAVQTAIVDHDGTIVATNEAWRRFAADIGGGSGVDVGTSYVTVCSGAVGEWAEGAGAGAVAAGLGRVLGGECESFHLEYPCPSPTEERWYSVRMSALPGGRAVVSHLDVTERKLVEGAVRRHVDALAMAEMEEARARADRAAELDRLGDYRDAARPTEGAPRAAELLRDGSSVVFGELSQRVGKILDDAIEERHFDVDNDVTGQLRAVAATLGALGAGPRDVVELYEAAMRDRVDGAPPSKAKAYVEEGRFVLLQALGHLTRFYRDRVVAAPSS